MQMMTKCVDEWSVYDRACIQSGYDSDKCKISAGLLADAVLKSVNK